MRVRVLRHCLRGLKFRFPLTVLRIIRASHDVAATLRRVLQFDRHSSARVGIECIKGSVTVFRGCNSKEDTERTFAQAALRKQPWESPCQPVNLEAGDLRNIPPHGGMNRKRRPPRGEKSVLHVTVELWTRETTARDACRKLCLVRSTPSYALTVYTSQC
jgi:hypothetical protein